MKLLSFLTGTTVTGVGMIIQSAMSDGSSSVPELFVAGVTTAIIGGLLWKTTNPLEKVGVSEWLTDEPEEPVVSPDDQLRQSIARLIRTDPTNWEVYPRPFSSRGDEIWRHKTLGHRLLVNKDPIYSNEKPLHIEIELTQGNIIVPRNSQLWLLILEDINRRKLAEIDATRRSADAGFDRVVSSAGK